MFVSQGIFNIQWDWILAAFNEEERRRGVVKRNNVSVPMKQWVKAKCAVVVVVVVVEVQV